MVRCAGTRGPRAAAGEGESPGRRRRRPGRRRGRLVDGPGALFLRSGGKGMEQRWQRTRPTAQRQLGESQVTSHSTDNKNKNAGVRDQQPAGPAPTLFMWRLREYWHTRCEPRGTRKEESTNRDESGRRKIASHCAPLCATDNGPDETGPPARSRRAVPRRAAPRRHATPPHAARDAPSPQTPMTRLTSATGPRGHRDGLNTNFAHAPAEK